MRPCRGFTFIEMSIMLVIVGLVIGGIMVGRDMIKNAQLRVVLSEVEQITTATQTFQTKYGCLPGDCANATSFFDQATNCYPNGWDFAGMVLYTAASCNGNGDGKILGNMWTSWEGRYFWHHLKTAGLMNLTLTRPAYGFGHDSLGVTAGDNVPASKFGDRTLLIVDNDALGGVSRGWGVNADGTVWDSHPPVDLGNFILVASTGTNDPIYSPGFVVFTPHEAQSIDAKMDDGYSNAGLVLGYPTYIGGPPCMHVPAVGVKVRYRTDVGWNCGLFFIHRFE